MFEIPFKYKNLIKSDKGLTNDNYLLEIDDIQYMVRVPKDDTRHLFNRNAEEEILKEIEDEDFIFKNTYYKDGLQLTEYKENLLNFEDYDNDDKILKVSELMKKLHKTNIHVKHNFNPLKQTQLYYDNIKDKPFDLGIYQDLFDKYSKHTFTPVLCHNDWVEGNICYVNDHTYLIDFEYAGMNDPYFDIMSFITENDLSDDEKIEFINLMFEDKVSNKDKEILEMYRDINNLLWYLWALMMYEFRDEEIYKEIAEIKLKQLTHEYKTSMKL